MNIGFIGTGIMGSRMASHLVEVGHSLVVHNRTQQKATKLVAQGAKWAETPGDVSIEADYLITMLAHPKAVEKAALDDVTGFLGTLQEGTIWIDCSTVNPVFARRMAMEANNRGIRFLDAPVAGSKEQAEKAQLVFLVGGSNSDVQACRELFESMGRQINHVGEHGMGNALKLVLNNLLATIMISFAEGLTLGEGLGISQETLLNTLIGAPITPPYLAGKRRMIETSDYEAEFPLRLMQKDCASSFL